MKNSNKNKKIIKKIAAVLGAASVIAIPTQQEVAKALELNNSFKNEQIMNSPTSEINFGLRSSIRDEFKDSNESIDEQDDINALIDAAKQNILNYIEINAGILEGDDKTAIEYYDTDAVFATLFENETLLDSLYEQTWENTTFENELKVLIDNYKELKEIQDNLSNSNEADTISGEIKNEIDQTTENIAQKPNVNERTELFGEYLLGMSTDLWKDLSIGGAIVAIMLGASIYGLRKAQKARRIALSNSDIEYFVGKEHIKEAKLLISTAEEVEAYDTQIKDLLNIANIAKNNGDIKKYEKYVNKARKLEKDNNYLTLKNKKEHLIVRISNIVNKNLEKNNKSLDSILKYAKNSKKIVKLPEYKNKKLGEYILKNADRIATLKNIKIKRRRYRFIRKFSRFINKGKRRALKFVFRGAYEKYTYFRGRNLTSKVNNSTLLTGVNKILLNKLLNKNFSEFNKEDLEMLYNLGDSLLVSDRKIFKKLMDNLYLTAKAEKLNNNDKLKESSEEIENSTKLMKKIKILDPSFETKYFGYRNTINNKTPINPIRYVCSNNKDVMNYYDRIINTFINKEKKIYELTVNYKNKNVTETVVCSLDNKDAMKLVKAKILTTLPIKNIEEIEVIEKTIPYINGKPEIVKTNYNLAEDQAQFNQILTVSNNHLTYFDNLFNRYTGDTPIPEDKPNDRFQSLSATEILNQINEDAGQEI